MIGLLVTLAIGNQLMASHPELVSIHPELVSGPPLIAAIPPELVSSHPELVSGSPQVAIASHPELVSSHPELVSGPPQIASDLVSSHSELVSGSSQELADVASASLPETTISASVSSSIEATVGDAEPVATGNFFSNNWGALLMGLLGFADLVARLTPSVKDNSILNFLSTILNAIIPNLKKGGGRL